jgi:hypothetical protein
MVVVVPGAGHGTLQVGQRLFQSGITISQGHDGGAQARVAVAQIIE